ncbi:CDP-glycerol glycerophosphotransferase family protein [Streptomyces sp. NPDC059688]|uniref:CDP-glycerol glycerophosphotransferase family protein n=1 Tax=Streptomyces albidocamelliae TaxID=2981135 RepID=A0ABY6ETT5_9ACTN|nr:MULTISPECIES: CDP-glycerol glycerophosphotransferase family protein [unclassified Streptomyces]UXY37809.1 CDP-glycerol glycerophosphotransferase family protein [Streptomyces sp. HUAS 14-6]
MRAAAVRLFLPTVIALSFAAQAAGALLPSVPLLVASTAVGLAADLALHRWQRGMATTLGKLHATVTVRQAVRDLLLVTGLIRIEDQDYETKYMALACGLLIFYALHFASQALAIVVRRSRTLPILTRNIDASPLRLSPAPPALLMRRSGQRLLVFGLPATAGLLVAAIADSGWAAAAGIGLSAVLALAAIAVLAARLRSSRKPVTSEEALEWFESWLAEYQPTVGMYFSGGTSSAYQANMWLEPLARLEGRPLIVLRERFMMRKIASTDIPIVCLPKVADVMRLEQSTLKMLIHPSNSGKTSQVLRIPTIKHAFVNHGESDKLSSCNPYAKAYDEVWVAGPAARERYALANVGVDDKDIVEIGRPQLDVIKPYAGAPTGSYTTVLYAPTWEGWDGNPGNTSVIEAGENIVRSLLADPGVRLLYKPHPLTGSVEPRAGAANLRIQEMIRAAVATRAAEHANERPAASAAAELERRTAELDRLTTSSFRDSADDAERMLLQAVPETGRAAAVAAATAAWETAYWDSFPAWEHLIVTDARPNVYACFNVADLLISDVSSVISDYLASGKPYAVTNTSGLPERDFRTTFPTVRAGAVLTPDASGMPALLESVRNPENDPYAAARTELKEHLLGPSDPPSVVRFNDASRALCAKAEEHRAGMAVRALMAIPSQRDAESPGQRDAETPGQRDAESPADNEHVKG